MFFTPIAPATYRTNARLGLERFLQEVARPQHAPSTPRPRNLNKTNTNTA